MVVVLLSTTNAPFLSLGHCLASTENEGGPCEPEREKERERERKKERQTPMDGVDSQ